MPEYVNVKRNIGDQSIIFETGKLAKMADGSVTVSYGETAVLVTVVSVTELKEDQDFLPLQVEYREKAAAAGRFPGGYFRKEGRPTDKEILTSRMIDRPLRPLFPTGYFYETQILGTLLSADGQNDPDILAINGASAALMLSDVPFNGPVGAVRIGQIDGRWIINPTHREREISDVDLVYVGSEHYPLMIEGSAREFPEEEFIKALAFAHQSIQELISAQKELAEKAGKPKRQCLLFKENVEITKWIADLFSHQIEAALYVPSKTLRHNSLAKIKQEISEKIIQSFPHATPMEISWSFDLLQREIFRRNVLTTQKRCDGRGLEDLRPITIETSIFPRSHGSALFSRGETQALCMATLASLNEAQELDAYGGGEQSKRFLLHYFFPPFSVGEVGKVFGQSRREIGHGALAERSLLPVIPSETDFPYAIRVSSEILESNGSTSMATVCGGSLALMDAGVPLKANVAGISVGLVKGGEDDFDWSHYCLLTDIIGLEDHYGDMDFKIAGTKKGITGFQLDLKLKGIPLEVMEKAVFQSKRARLIILEHMDKVINVARPEISKHAPRIEKIKIHPDKIGLLIGPGGKTIKRISAESGAEITIEDDGTVLIYSSSAESLESARAMIEDMVGEVTVGGLYRSKVVSVKDFGCFIEIKGKGEGLVHISELSDTPVRRVDQVVRVGEEIWVKCIGVDEKGRYKFSRKAAMKELQSKGIG
ncbi:polynucleotide phosphorylase [Methylacidiphilum kamchatkense Kam1]|uniref:Polyribonucleotide nucleotidyltransferase n=1 Tax=Methylacidiphilum kamchatkense Kam1 TaxID=1202785 RepID=A0A0C1RSE5_9BACT|nr:polyribonucleotide nucleotidyltransferase [Methylacidiphilum kamchatkense]KIE57836.1 polynucleotide phosphorylase [Methylacidiphilum kamchatkense Kam1]QDQ41458.1 polyribonucleotide nucleotidyltransferase [Methylacidiphilum kamchatkense Kam1]